MFLRQCLCSEDISRPFFGVIPAHTIGHVMVVGTRGLFQEYGIVERASDMADCDDLTLARCRLMILLDPEGREEDMAAEQWLCSGPEGHVPRGLPRSSRGFNFRSGSLGPWVMSRGGSGDGARAGG
jgi:hypothetical protein